MDDGDADALGKAMGVAREQFGVDITSKAATEELTQAWGTRVENSNAYWYVTSQVAQPQEKPVLPAPSVEVEDSVSDLMAPLATQETETAACLIGQALVEQNGTN